MESILLSIDPHDPLWIALAFAFGIGARSVGLPPLVGFLITGYILNALGVQSGEFLHTMADLGVTLLLFTIGLKLKVRSLTAPEIWGVAVTHMLGTTLLIGAFVMTISVLGLPLIADIDLKTSILVGFALSFSSTVFAVKVLDELGATASRHGRISIGVLIIQDIAAVAFLVISTGKIPSIWAVGLLLLIPARHILHRILSYTGHGELLILFGIVLAIGGADLFELVGMKGDLGALILGMLLADHVKSKEMAKELLSFKDLFLLGFFLSVGMTALPGWEELVIASLFIVFLPIKVALYFGLFSLFRLRSSTSWRSSLNLANYSEFGLIVGIIAVSAGLLDDRWLSVFAITLSLSYIVAAPVVAKRDRIYANWRHYLKRFERQQNLLTSEENLNLGSCTMAVFGMGRIGSAVYDSVEQEFPGCVMGVDMDDSKALLHREKGRTIAIGDGTNPDFWSRVPGFNQQFNWVMLTLPNHRATLSTIKYLREAGYTGQIAATAKFPEELEELKELDVKFAFNIYHEAGHGFVNDLRKHLG